MFFVYIEVTVTKFYTMPYLNLFLRGCLIVCYMGFGMFMLSCKTTLPSFPAFTDRPPVFEDQLLTPEEEQTILDGIDLHEAGDFDKAIETYYQVLAVKPNSALTHYQIAYAYNMKQDLKKSIEYTGSGLRIDSELRYMLFHLDGISRDMLGDHEGALAAFRAGIKEAPDFFQLHYSTGLALMHLGRVDEAQKYFMRSLELNPWHPGSHFQLGATWFTLGKSFPALLAYCYSWVFQENELLSINTAMVIKDLLTHTAEAEITENGKRRYNINIPILPGDDDDPLSSMEILMALRGMADAAQMEGQTEAERVATSFGMILGFMSQLIERNPDESGFIWDLYLPFWNEMYKNDHHTPFIYLVMGDTDLPGVNDWLHDNDEIIESLVDWINFWFDGEE